MSSIPGFENGGGLSESAPFDRLSESDAVAIARDTFGVHALSAKRLDTERDDSFHVLTADEDFGLKVAHPDDPIDIITLQTEALRWAGERDAALPLQRVLRSTDGRLEPVVNGRTARLLTWLPGVELFDLQPDQSQLATIGSTLARLALALRGFEHPAASRPFAWNALQAGGLAPLLEQLPNEAAAEALRRLEVDVLPVVGDLPMQVIHNDFHLGNVLADPDSEQYVVGILDFGDVALTARVVDVALTASYLLFPAQRSWDDVETFIAGYERITVLSPGERRIIRPLVATRFAQRILINQWLARGNPGGRNATAAAVEGNTRALTALLNSEDR